MGSGSGIYGNTADGSPTREGRSYGGSGTTVGHRLQGICFSTNTTAAPAWCHTDTIRYEAGTRSDSGKLTESSRTRGVDKVTGGVAGNTSATVSCANGSSLPGTGGNGTDTGNTGCVTGGNNGTGDIGEGPGTVGSQVSVGNGTSEAAGPAGGNGDRYKVIGGSGGVYRQGTDSSATLEGRSCCGSSTTASDSGESICFGRNTTRTPLDGGGIAGQTLTIGSSGETSTVGTIVVEDIAVGSQAGQVVYGTLGGGGVRTAIGYGESAGDVCSQINLVGGNSLPSETEVVLTADGDIAGVGTRKITATDCTCGRNIASDVRVILQLYGASTVEDYVPTSGSSNVQVVAGAVQGGGAKVDG